MARSATIAFAILFFSSLRADVIYVPEGYAAIQDAINASVDGDTILVAPGTYTENINFRGKNVHLASEYIFDRNPETIAATVINGGSPANVDTGSCVIINSGEDSSAVLEGFTLTAGIGTKWIDEHGAGTYIEGGGILIQYSSPTIMNNRIVGNTAIRVYGGAVSAGGGGIRIGDSTPKILNNVIMDNEGLYGGGIVLNYTGATVKNNVVANNRVYPAAGSAPTFGGGGFWISSNFGSSTKVLENNTIYGNSVAGFGGRGGGILVGGTTVTARNNIVWNNTQTTGSQISGGTISVSYCDVQGGYTGTGNIDADPLISDTSFYLEAGSPCIDAGNSSPDMNDPEDPMNPGFALWPSQGALRNDIGVYGGPGSTPMGSFSVTSVDDPGTGEFPVAFRLLQNYPNPFNPSTVIQFEIPVSGEVTLEIFDILGRSAGILVHDRLDAGNHEVTWDASGFTGGVYFARLASGNQVETRKLLLLK